MVEEIIEAISEQLKIDPSTLTEQTSILDDIGADSLDIVELLMTLEDRYGVIVPDDEASKLKTIGDIADYIEENK